MAPWRPPQTPREVVHLLFGPDHIDHCVIGYEKRGVSVYIQCSCQQAKTFNLVDIHSEACTFSEIMYGLRNAPPLYDIL